MEGRKQKKLATAEFARRVAEATKLTRIGADGSEQLAAAQTEENASCWMTSARGGWSARKRSGRARDERAFVFSGKTLAFAASWRANEF